MSFEFNITLHLVLGKLNKYGILVRIPWALFLLTQLLPYYFTKLNVIGVTKFVLKLSFAENIQYCYYLKHVNPVFCFCQLLILNKNNILFILQIGEFSGGFHGYSFTRGRHSTLHKITCTFININRSAFDLSICLFVSKLRLYRSSGY